MIPTGLRKLRSRGQALIMVTLAIMAMCGMMGLVLELGWSFVVKKTAQTAADAAALAGVGRAYDTVSAGGGVACGGELVCVDGPVSCDSGVTGALAAACAYAERNGFTPGGGGGKQTVTVEANTTAPPPTAPGVSSARYWITVRISQRIPQLFSAVLGNTVSTVSARATAALAPQVVKGSLILTNRESDPSGTTWSKDGPSQGVNLQMGGGGNGTITAPQGILLASSLNGSSPRPAAGFIKGGGTVQSPFTWIRGTGNLSLSNESNWENGFVNKSDSATFEDPMAGMGQPPLTNTVLRAVPLLGGNLAAACPNGICQPANYFAVRVDKNNSLVATGGPILVNSDLTFASGSGFGDWVFFGGLRINSATVNFGAGRYVMAGVNAAGTPVFETDNGTTLVGGSGADAGRIFILTNTAYPGLQKQVNAVAATGAPLPATLVNFGTMDSQAGANKQSSVTLYGLDKRKSLPTEVNDLGYGLPDFAPSVIWQDQQNSPVRYDAAGEIVTSCGSSHSIDNPCTNPSSVDHFHMALQANQNTRYAGVLYQPRGAWLSLQGSDALAGPLQVISGALIYQGGGQIPLSSVDLPPLTVLKPALVE